MSQERHVASWCGDFGCLLPVCEMSVYEKGSKLTYGNKKWHELCCSPALTSLFTTWHFVGMLLLNRLMLLLNR